MAVVAASAVAATWLCGTGAAGQVPPIGDPPPTTLPAEPVPPGEDEPPPVPGPPEPPPTVAPGAPTPSTPATPVPEGGPTTTTTNPTSGSTASARSVHIARPAALSIDLSALDALRRQARGKGPRRPERDYGFDSSLPFQEGGGRGENASQPFVNASELGAEEEELARVRSAAAVAAGLMALLLVGFGIWVLRQARPAPVRPDFS